MVLPVPLLALSAQESSLPRVEVDAPAPEETSEISAAIERQVVCVGSTIESAGELGDVLYYRSSVDEQGKISVGYFAFFSEERPWGNNWLTWTVLPALAVDLVYTRSLFLGPGIQRFAYGKGDVEGFRIVYNMEDDGRLSVDHGVADSGDHSEVRLERADLLSIEPERPTVYSRWWSHQLGGQGARPDELVYRRCYGPGSIRPLPPEVALDFRLDRRAGPARVVPAAALLGQLAPPHQLATPELASSQEEEPPQGADDQDRAFRPSVAL